MRFCRLIDLDLGIRPFYFLLDSVLVVSDGGFGLLFIGKGIFWGTDLESCLISLLWLV